MLAPEQHDDRYAGMPAGLRRAIGALSAKHGVNPHVMMEIAKIESGGNGYKADTRNGSMLGVWQFDPKTAKAYGLNPAQRTDVWKSTDAAIRLYKDNAEELQDILGRKPKPGEVFLGHLMGLGGAEKILKNPHKNAVAVRGSSAILGNGGTAKDTCGQFRNRWVAHFDDAVKTPAPEKRAVATVTPRPPAAASSPKRFFTALVERSKTEDPREHLRSAPSRTPRRILD